MGQNFRVWADNSVANKGDVGPDNLVRETETGGKSVMCAAGLAYEGIVVPYIAERGRKQKPVYINMLKI